MSMTITQLGNNSGFVYVTKSDGVSIVANFANTASVWQQAQSFISSSLTDPTLQTDPAFGYRIFGNVAGTEGSLVGSTELTRFLINRGFQATAYKKSISIATGIILFDRVSSNTTLIVDTEGSTATDTLDTITSTDVVDNDTITIVGANPARIVTVAHGTGNVFLSNNANFASATRQTQLTLRYYSAATAGWYEVSRINSLPTVVNHRLVSVPEPVSGVNSTGLTAGGGTINLTPGVDKGYQTYSGFANLTGSWVIQINPAPTIPYLDGDEMTVDYRAILTTAGNTVTILGVPLTTTQALEGRVIVYSKYNLATTTWYSRISYDPTGLDITNKVYVDTTFEPYLLLPAADGFVLSSTAAGVRSWIPIVTPDTGWVDLIGFSFMPGGSRPQYRVIGKQLSFRGSLVVPLSNDGGTTLIPYAGESSYFPSFYSAPYTGSGATGGVLVSTNGSITFNQNGGVIDPSYFPDSTYSTSYIIAARRINSDIAGEVIAYTATVIMSITPLGRLVLTTMFDFENLTSATVGYSPLRFLNSNVTSGDYALDFRVANTADTLFGITANTALPLTIKQQTFKHQLTFDAALAQNIGGFSVNITGLTGFLS